MATRSKARPRQSYHHGDLGPTLLATARAMISELGADELSLRELARRVGVSHVAVYGHFADKRALFAAVAATGFSELEAKLRRGAEKSRGGVHAKLRGMLRAYIEFCFAEPALCALMFGPRLGERGEFPELDTAVDKSLVALSEPIERHAPPALLAARPAKQIAIDLWTFAHGYGTLSFNKRVYGSAAAAAQAFEQALAPMLRGLFGPEPVTRSKSG